MKLSKSELKTRIIIRLFFVLLGLSATLYGAAKALEIVEFMKSAAVSKGQVKVYKKTGLKAREEYLITFSIKTRDYSDCENYSEQLYETEERYFAYKSYNFWINNPWVSFNDNEIVTVYYDPQNPQKAIVDRFASAYAFPLCWFIPGVLILILGVKGLIKLRKTNFR